MDYSCPRAFDLRQNVAYQTSNVVEALKKASVF